MSITELAIKRPTLIVVIFTILGFLGILSYSKLNYELMPKFSSPVVSVTTIYPGASPSEVENSVTKRIADIMYLKAESSYCRVILKIGEGYIIYRTIKYIKNKLPINFIRTHHSYLVNILFEKFLIDNDSFVLKNKFQISISRRKKDILKSLNNI